MSKTVIIQAGQSLVDIALQEFGSAEGLFLILRANPTIEHVDDLLPGTKLLIDSDAINVAIANHFFTNNIQVATATNFNSLSNLQYLESDYVESGYII